MHRLEDRIREFCAQALYDTGAQWEHTIDQLQLAIQEHSLRVANRATAATLGGKPEVLVERRERQGYEAPLAVAPTFPHK
jgi:hypothetical protein